MSQITNQKKYFDKIFMIGVHPIFDNLKIVFLI